MDCIFCRIDRPLFAETRLSFAFLDGFPVCNGHSLVVPKRHVVSLWEMGNDEYTDAFDLVRRVKDILQEKFQPQGFNWFTAEWSTNIPVSSEDRLPFVARDQPKPRSR